MLQVNTKGAIAKLRAQKNRYQQSISIRLKNKVLAIFEDIVLHTPQWSGNLASNWTLEVGVAWGGTAKYYPIFEYDPVNWRDVTPIKQAGHPEALETALKRNAAAIDRIKWNSRISIVNATDYAGPVEQGIGPEGRAIREVNKFAPYGVAMVQYAKLKYGRLGYLNG